MVKFKIEKEPLQPHFLGVNFDTVGSATGCLKHCGLKLYLYLMSNSDGFVWNMNPVAFANWLNVDYNNASEARKVRKVINDGIVDLKEHGFLKEEEKDSYIISEQIVPEWLDSKVGTICSGNIDNKNSTFGTNCSKNIEQSLGTNCSEVDAQKEKIVPDCYGF